MRRRVTLLAGAGTLAVILTAAVVFGFWAREQLSSSLPVLEGTLHLAGLGARVTVARDALGIPTIGGASRDDVARATGFVHAQDRFFQMDLSRRRAAGELSALVGGRALALDVEVRLHRFRAVARRALELMRPEERRLLEAYAGGVNSGLAALASRPFEYHLLQHDPQPWLAEDSLLVVLSMFITLQDTDGSYEATLATMHDVLPRAMFEFMTPDGTEWDAPVVGPSFSVPPVPGPDVYDLRTRRAGKPGIEFPSSRPPSRQDRVEGQTIGNPLALIARAVFGADPFELPVDSPEAALGSNNWAVAGRLTADGGALVANDMHLNVRVPNIWYRAMFELPDASGASAPSRLAGVTLPGFPALVAGSNTHVAWGFTNTYADWGDLVLIEIDPADPNRYLTPDGPRTFERFEEVIEIAGQDSRREQVTWTIWGPLLGPDHRGRLRAYRWVAHDADRLARAVTPLEAARSLEEALEAANGLGTPGQNIVVADRTGRIGWSIYGSIPRRVGVDGQLPSSWADGTRGWRGWLEASEYPRLVDPPGGRIWTANARVVDGAMLAALGDGSYEVGSRATMIRERLLQKDRFTAADMLDIQLDTRARFLARWRELALRTLTPAAVAGRRERAQFRELLDRGWTGHASAESVGYRLTRLFRDQVSERVLAFVLAECYEADPSFDHTTLRRREGPVWKLVTEKPLHLLDGRYASWDELLLAAVDFVIARTSRDGDLAERAWSEYNVTTYRHPLSPSLPFVGRLLDMPFEPVPGDLYTPRVHWGSVAASMRMAVSPGREANGIMQMPTGQSGHPWSPFYANSHAAWVKGEGTPFLPGPQVYTLTLVP